MECCVGVSTETVLQIDKFYTVVRRHFELGIVEHLFTQIPGFHCQIFIHSYDLVYR